MESEFFVESLGFSFCSFVKIENSPFLVILASVVLSSYCLTFFVFASCNIENLVVGPIDELAFFELEDLEPSRVGAPDLHIISFS